MGGVGPQGDRTEQTDLQASSATELHRLLGDTGARAVGDEYVLGIVAVDHFITDFVLGHFIVLALEVTVVFFHAGGVEVQRGDDAMLRATLAACQCPRILGFDFLFGEAGLLFGQDDLFHHLANGTVGEDTHCHTILEGEVEAQRHEVSHFLDGSGGEDDVTIVAVAATLGVLEIVSL